MIKLMSCINLVTEDCGLYWYYNLIDVGKDRPSIRDIKGHPKFISC